MLFEDKERLLQYLKHQVLKAGIYTVESGEEDESNTFI